MQLRKRVSRMLTAVLASALMPVSAFAAAPQEPAIINPPARQSSITAEDALDSLGYPANEAWIRMADAPDTNCAGDTVVATGDLLV